MMPMIKLIAAILFFTCGPVFAEPAVKMSGFGTLGVVVTDSDEFGYRSDFSSAGGVFSDEVDFAESSNFGAQFDIIMHPQFDAVVQLSYRNQNEIKLDSVLNMAFVRYSPNPNWSFRGGRLAFDLFLLTEYRDINFAYPWAHVPAEIYGVIPYRNIDGIDTTYSRRIGTGTFSSKLFFGESEADVTGLGSPDVISVRFGEVVGIALDYRTMGWDISLNHSRVKFDSQLMTPLVNGIKQLNALVPGFDHIWPNSVRLANGMELDNTKGAYTSVGGQYYMERMTFIAELARISADSLSVPNVEGGYLSGIYHAGEHNFFATFAFSQTEQVDTVAANLALLQHIPGGLEIYQSTQLSLSFYSVNQQTLSLGWRWDLTEKLSFKLQWDHTRIDRGGSTLWQPVETFGNLDKPTGHVNAIFSNLSFAF